MKKSLIALVGLGLVTTSPANAQKVNNGGPKGIVLQASSASAAPGALAVENLAPLLPAGYSKIIVTKVCVSGSNSECSVKDSGVTLLAKFGADRSTKCEDFDGGFVLLNNDFTCDNSIAAGTNCECTVTGVAVK